MHHDVPDASLVGAVALVALLAVAIVRWRRDTAPAPVTRPAYLT